MILEKSTVLNKYVVIFRPEKNIEGFQIYKQVSFMLTNTP